MATTKRSPKGESKVRNYLAFLQDPESILNHTVIAKAQKALDECTEPIEALRLYRALQQAKTPDGSKLEAAFIAVAKEWADKEGIDGNVFLEVHDVPRTVLKEAGFNVRSGVYKKRVTSGEVQAHVMRIEGVFGVADVVEVTGASVAGARNVLNDMIEAGQLELAPRGDRKFRGRPSTLYQKV